MQNFISFTVAELILFCLVSSTAGAATIVSESCSREHLGAAIAKASDGDTVTIPSGTCTWGSPVTVPSGKSITVQGQTPTVRDHLTYRVTATDHTVIQSEGRGFVVGEPDGVRLTGLTLSGMSVAIVMPSPARGMRVDHCNFMSVSRVFDKSVRPKP